MLRRMRNILLTLSSYILVGNWFYSLFLKVNLPASDVRYWTGGYVLRHSLTYSETCTLSDIKRASTLVYL